MKTARETTVTGQHLLQRAEIERTGRLSLSGVTDTPKAKSELIRIAV